MSTKYTIKCSWTNNIIREIFLYFFIELNRLGLCYMKLKKKSFFAFAHLVSRLKKIKGRMKTSFIVQVTCKGIK